MSANFQAQLKVWAKLQSVRPQFYRIKHFTMFQPNRRRKLIFPRPTSPFLETEPGTPCLRRCFVF